MPTAVVEIPPRPLAQDLPRKRWTRAECAVVESSGVFGDQRFELIEGELISKMGKKRPHVGVVKLLARWFERVFGERSNTEAPIDVASEDNATNEPEPDLIVLKAGYPAYWSSTPQARDLDLVVEVADTTLAFDMTIKAALYARAGIVEYWVLDIQGRRLIVHRDPARGQYASIVGYSEQECVTPLAAPGAPFRVAEMLPPKTS